MNYVTVQECDEYAVAHFTSYDNALLNWDSLSDEDKQVLITKAHDIIEALPFSGRKTKATQENTFPRYPDAEVPVEVKNAECEQAISLSDITASEAFNDYRKMIQYGIQSYSIGNFSETLLTYSKNSVEIQYGLSSENAKRLLTPWLTGGYRIE